MSKKFAYIKVLQTPSYERLRLVIQRHFNCVLTLCCFATQLSSGQVSRIWEFNQSGFEGLGIQPIRFRGAVNSANQVLRGWHSANYFSRAGSSANQLFLLSSSDAIGFFHAGVSSNQIFKVVVPVV